MRLFLFALLGIMFGAPSASACDGREITANVFSPPVCIPKEPRRIVVLDYYYSLGMGLELGASIVGAPLFGMQNERLEAKAKAASVEDIGHITQPSPEKIIALKPDLILGEAVMHARAYEIAKKIAPTVFVQVQNWKDYYATIAEVTARQGVSDADFKAYEKRAAGIRAKMPDDVRVSVVRIVPAGFQVYVDGPGAYGPFSVLQEAGVKRTDYETATDNIQLKRPDWERLAELDGDVLLYIVGGGHHTDERGTLEEETLANPLWQMLPAVQAGRAYRVDPVTWMAFSGIESANRVLDDVERFILKTP